MLPPLIESLLRGLQYPRYDAAMDLADVAQLRSLVGWLENAKIRLYPASGPERQDLASANAAIFQPALAKYLSDLECPYTWSAPSGPESLLALQWLLSHAAGLEYDDRANALNAVVEQAVQQAKPAREWSRRELPSFPDTHAPEAQEALKQWLHLLHIEATGEVTSELVHRARSVLQTQLLPAAEWQARHPGVGLTPAALLEGVPLGFSTGDEAADAAAKVLRMLLVGDLRRVQTRADEAIEELQALTANPRTDVAIGRTGR